MDASSRNLYFTLDLVWMRAAPPLVPLEEIYLQAQLEHRIANHFYLRIDFVCLGDVTGANGDIEVDQLRLAFVLDCAAVPRSSGKDEDPPGRDVVFDPYFDDGRMDPEFIGFLGF